MENLSKSYVLRPDLPHDSITVTPEAAEKVGVLVQLYPIGEARYLSPNLQLTLRSKAGKTLQSTQSRGQDNYIQLKSFKGKPGTRFSNVKSPLMNEK